MASPYVTSRLDDTSRVQSLERRVLIVSIPNNNMFKTQVELPSCKHFMA